MLEFIEKHIEGSDFEGDWLDAVVIALNFLKEETERTKCRNKKIVLLSDLGCAANKDKLEVIAKGMQVGECSLCAEGSKSESRFSITTTLVCTPVTFFIGQSLKK